MKSKTELLAIVQGNCPKLDVARMRDIVDELETEGDVYSRINMQLTAQHWGLTVSEVYYLIDPIRA
tara:strand:+ start:181 stop:378 length:198 start_codon:yes stop_codon:yes gene_type:complete